jgi:hypothetical protein
LRIPLPVMPLPGMAGRAPVMVMVMVMDLVRARPTRFTLAGLSYLCVTLLVVLLSWPDTAAAMRQSRIVELRQETVDMFYHGFDNYMEIAFPEDEVWHTL